MIQFQVLLEMLFGWLPPGLYACVVAVVAAAFLVIMIKIVTVLLSLLTKVIGIFI